MDRASLKPKIIGPDRANVLTSLKDSLPNGARFMSGVITRRVFCLGTASTALLLSLPARAAPAHGIAMHGEPALPANFDHLPYADPAAPKGGTFALGFPGSFDSLNPFIIKGNAPRGLSDALYGNNVWDTLLHRSADEAFSLYGLLAESIEMPPDRSWVEFTLNAAATFADGEPVTVDDVLFTVDLLKTKGRPVYKRRFDKVVSVDRVGERTLRFSFADGADRELPLVIGGYTPILPRHAVDPDTFDQSSMKPIMGSGPYQVASVDEGRQVVLKRNPDYWARELPIKRGLDNFDEIRIEYFKDGTSYFEAFKSGAFDLYIDSDPGHWAKAYDFPAAKDGRVALEKIANGSPKGMTGFVFNTRREIFKDVRVREALTRLFDFEAVNRTLYYGAYARSGSYFEGSSLSALGVPASTAEKALLAPFEDQVRPDVMDGTYAPPVSDGTGREPQGVARRPRSSRRSWLEARGEAAGGCRRQTVHLRVHGQGARRRAARPQLSGNTQAGRHRHVGAAGRLDTVLRSPEILRLRYAPDALDSIAVARQRTDEPLVAEGRRHRGHLQLCRRVEPGDRRHDRRPSGRHRPRRVRDGRSGPRPPADLRPLLRTTLSSARGSGRPLDACPPPGDDGPDRHPAVRLVGGREVLTPSSGTRAQQGKAR